MLNTRVTLWRYPHRMRNPAQSFFRRVDDRGAPDHMRRLLDVLIALGLLAMTAPLMLLTAVAIKAESRGPILVSENCVGLGGRRFRMLKFRTVPHDPDCTTPSWAGKATPLGVFLQYTRIEALPRLMNVVRGEMSIIDPDGRSPCFLD